MWRESWQRVMVVVVALAAACTNTDADSSSTTSELQTTTTEITTTTTAPTTTATTETAPTTAEFTEVVGSPDALAEEVADVRGFVSVLFSDDVADSIPTPDLTNADPAVAVRELLLFETTVIQIATVREYADLLAIAQSPAYGSLRRDLDTFENNKLRIVVKGDYEIHSVAVISDEEGMRVAGVEVHDSAPEGSVFVSYETSLAPYDIVRDDGSLVQTEDGWERRNRVALVSPSRSGWKYFWVES